MYIYMHNIYIYICIHTCYIYIYIYIDTYIYIYIYTHVIHVRCSNPLIGSNRGHADRDHDARRSRGPRNGLAIFLVVVAVVVSMKFRLEIAIIS